jgi:hypothetical protein
LFSIKTPCASDGADGDYCAHEEMHRNVPRESLRLRLYRQTCTTLDRAAPTTSLPERFGGTRNWDYRYCWLRDATFRCSPLMSAGYTREAAAGRDWLVRAVAGRRGQIYIMYRIGGERCLNELELPRLPRFEDSKPVASATRRTGSSSSTYSAKCSTACIRAGSWSPHGTNPKKASGRSGTPTTLVGFPPGEASFLGSRTFDDRRP